jgi:MarR family transcriptional regulator, lower aerobic nicotinate degradation pathway regulator
MGSHPSALASANPAARAEETDIRAILDALRRVVRELRLSARDAERDAGISGAQLFVLQTLSRERATSLSDLAVRTLTDQSSVSVVVRRLVDRKLVARKTPRDDARRVELSLTAAGRRMLARCPEPTQARLFEALHCMSAADLSSLTSGLGALVREMRIEDEAPQMFFEEGPEARPRASEGTPRDDE